MAVAGFGDFGEVFPAAAGFRLSAGEAQALFSLVVGWEVQKNAPASRAHVPTAPPAPRRHPPTPQLPFPLIFLFLVPSPETFSPPLGWKLPAAPPGCQRWVVF